MGKQRPIRVELTVSEALALVEAAMGFAKTSKTLDSDKSRALAFGHGILLDALRDALLSEGV